MQDQDIVQEFLVESAENLARLDQEMVELEREPENRDLLGSIFRTIHTIKGTCGFLGFNRLEAISHVTEDILSQLRNAERRLDKELTSLILESVDAIKRILSSIEASAGEGDTFETGLISRLEQCRDQKPSKTEPLALGPIGIEHPDPVRFDTPDSSTGSVAAASGSQKPGSNADTTLRVDVALLDRLMNLVGELVLTRNQVVQYNAARNDATLNTVSQRLNLITSELQEGVMKTRMQPIRVVWNKLPRIVRDLAATLNKEINLEMDGEDTELDRTIIDAIKDPLIHIVRNACDHGIEATRQRLASGKPARGRLALRAFHEGGQVNIEISDDGAGIDPQRVKAKAIERGLISADQAQRLPDRDAVNLVFLPGFSTAQTVTSISGRGVGMDVVRTHIERIGGVVDLVSVPGQGTTVRVKIPLTLAIIPGLIVCAGGERFVIPQINLHELMQLDSSRTGIEYVHTTPVLRRREMLLPLTDLCEVFGLKPQRSSEDVSIVILQADEHRFGLIVDSISDSQDIVVKPLGQQLKGLNCYAGATIMGDGKIALILDVTGLGFWSGVIQQAGQSRRSAAAPNASAGANSDGRALLLLFRAGGYERLAVPLSRVARLEKIPWSSVERAADRMVIQYRDRILPLLSLGGIPDCSGEDSGLHVVVFRHGSSELGLIVDEITDIVEEAVAKPYASDRSGLLGSAVVGGRVTDFLDLDEVAQQVAMASTGSLERLQQVLSSGIHSFQPEEVAQ